MVDNYTSLIQIISTLAGTALTGFIAYKMAQLKATSEQAAAAAIRASQEAAHKVENVAINLKLAELLAHKKMAKIEETTDKTLVHVNDMFLSQLRLYMESTRIVAELRKTPADIQKADAAERMYKEHEGKQIQARTDKQATDAVSAVAEQTIKNSDITSVTLEKPEPVVKN